MVSSLQFSMMILGVSMDPGGLTLEASAQSRPRLRLKRVLLGPRRVEADRGGGPPAARADGLRAGAAE